MWCSNASLCVPAAAGVGHVDQDEGHGGDVVDGRDAPLSAPSATPVHAGRLLLPDHGLWKR